MRPDAKLHNPDPVYLRSLLAKAGISKSEAARRLGMSRNGFSNYLRDRTDPLYRAADYCVQFTLECLTESQH